MDTQPRRPSPFDPGTRFALIIDSSRNEVPTASDGSEALEIAPAFPFSLIITDIEMPHLDNLPTKADRRETGIDAFFPKGAHLGSLVE